MQSFAGGWAERLRGGGWGGAAWGLGDGRLGLRA
jgi:hypothetical protein